MFKPGDLVEVIRRKSRHLGKITTVRGWIIYGIPIVEVDIPHSKPELFRFCAFKPEDLRKIDDKDQVVKWEDCIWQPKKETI